MTALRRTATVVGLLLALVIGSGVAASATFSDSTAVSVTLTARTVQPPASVSTAGTKCVSRQVWNGYGYSTVWELQAKVSWPASSTATAPRGISGYRVSALIGTTSYPITDVGATTLSVTDTYPIEYATANIRVTVTTLTAYGWDSAPSIPSATIKC